jgi:hypothetical protein
MGHILQRLKWGIQKLFSMLLLQARYILQTNKNLPCLFYGKVMRKLYSHQREKIKEKGTS